MTSQSNLKQAARDVVTNAVVPGDKVTSMFISTMLHSNPDVDFNLDESTRWDLLPLLDELCDDGFLQRMGQFHVYKRCKPKIRARRITL